MRVRLSDTAGLREEAEPIERLGIERARAALRESRLAIWVLDAGEPLAAEDVAIVEALAGRACWWRSTSATVSRVLDRAAVDIHARGDCLARSGGVRARAAPAWRRCVRRLRNSPGPALRDRPRSLSPRTRGTWSSLERARAALARASETAHGGRERRDRGARAARGAGGDGRGDRPASVRGPARSDLQPVLHRQVSMEPESREPGVSAGTTWWWSARDTPAAKPRTRARGLDFAPRCSRSSSRTPRRCPAIPRSAGSRRATWCARSTRSAA